MAYLLRVQRLAAYPCHFAASQRAVCPHPGHASSIDALIALLLSKEGVRIVATILIGGFALIAGFTIGLFYLPAAILLLLASCVPDAAKLRDVF